MVSVNELLSELESMMNKERKFIELFATVEYLISLVEPSKREKFKEALENAESVEEVYELIKAIKLQLGIQGAKKYVLGLSNE
ncbi:conserved hypothetical protein [Methanocaldococcus infernus ME]|uniref:Uncharacterized protein n=2 Tax=Methanocaldococcus infernus TaxID=67760 RepID=D5VSL5_METIM|nr:conserved hypothetical protein [Methanocaldococcus infernus ME]